MYSVNTPWLVESLCYTRDAANASAEWVFAKRVKLAGKDFVTRAYKLLEGCLHCKVLIETHPTPVAPLVFRGAMHLTDTIGHSRYTLNSRLQRQLLGGGGCRII